MPAWLGDAHPGVRAQRRAVEAKLELLSLVGAQVVRLRSFRLAARGNGAVVIMVVEHVRHPGS